MAEFEQWVNLERDAKFVADGITSIERVGEAVHFKCTFKGNDLGSFRYRVVPEEEAEYSRKEKGRNPHFKLRSGKGSTTNNGAGETTIENTVKLPAAGGNKYKIEVQWMDKGGSTLKTSDTVVTRRRLFYQSIQMSGLGAGAGDIGGMESDMEADYWDEPRKYYVKLLKKASTTIPLIKTMRGEVVGGSTSIANLDEMLNAAKPQYALSTYDPFAFVLVWSNYIATKGSTVVNQTVNVAAPAATWSYAGTTFTLETGKFLWYQLDDTDDANQEWLRSIDCYYTDAAGRPSHLRIPRDRASIAGPAHRSLGGHSQIAIDLSAADMSVIRDHFVAGAGSIRFQVTVNVTIGWTNGFSLGGINLITVADKAVWDPRTRDGKAQTLMHELGHKVGMTPSGTGRLPRKPSCYYTGQGHQGPHCSKGASYNAATRTWAGSPQCVMYGASHAARPRTFCAECAPLVRKLDMSPTMPGFVVPLSNA